MARKREPGVARRIGGVIVRLALGLVALVAAYLLAAVIGGAIPANAEWRPPAQGVRIYVADNGMHTDLVLPMVAEGVDWRDLLAPEDLADPAQAARSHVAVGWGDRDFYLNTPSWAQMNPWRAASALVGAGRTVVHAVHVDEPHARADLRAVTLRPEEYRRLAAFVRATFATGADGRAASVRGYGRADAFYEARGGYSAFNTCNQWTGSALRAAGVRIGAWTPLTFTVMQWL